jgi:zinc transport system substrate-binding protein
VSQRSSAFSHRTVLAGLVACAAAVLACVTALPTARAAASAPTVRIVTSFYPMYVATLNVTKDIPGVTVTNLTPPMTGCLHDYQMTTADLITLSKADVIVVNGAGMEGFLDEVIRQKPGARIVEAGAGLELIPGAGGIGNPHVWLSPSLHIRQVQAIAAGLARFDPPHADLYRRNAADYAVRLAALRERIQAGLKDIRSRDLITFHEAFPYFAREFGLNVVAVVEREPGSEPSAREMADTIALVRKTHVTALFAEPQYSAKAAESIVRETGAKLFKLDPIVTGPMTADAYVQAMDGNLKVLQQALGP